jgi:hypothetical protein
MSQEGWMRGAQMRRGAIVALAAGVLAGCGGKAEDAGTSPVGKVVAGETETGTKLKVESFVEPSADKLVAQADEYREAGGYPAVDFHRVTATAGEVADRLRSVRFASDPEELSLGKAVEGRFACDVLNYEWPPAKKATTETFQQLHDSLCAVEPTDETGIKPGDEVVYYLVTERGFAERGLRDKRIFGPLDAELR